MMSQNNLKTGRINQKQRTRQALIEAAEELMRGGRSISLADVTDAAMVSRATFYRYFASMDMLILDVIHRKSALSPDEFFADDDAPAGERVSRVHDALFDLVSKNESQFRLGLRSSLEDTLETGGYFRDARRIPMIEKALDRVGGRLDDATYDKLVYALSAMVGIEPFIALTDVSRLETAHAKEIMNWAVTTLTNAVLEQGR